MPTQQAALPVSTRFCNRWKTRCGITSSSSSTGSRGGTEAVDQLKSLIDNWILIAQGLIGSIGALAFLIAFMYKIIAVDPHSVMEAKGGIGRIVFGTIGVA